MQYLHTNCGGLIKSCPNNDQSYCDHCGKWINESDIIENRQMESVNNCSNLNQGGSKMKRSKQLINLIDGVIERQASYIPNEGYYLPYQELPDTDIEAITAQLMADDESFACEATGIDNPAYEKHMLPALLRHLKNPCDKDEQIEFMKEWRHGVANYARDTVESILEDRLEVHAFHMNQEGAA